MNYASSECLTQGVWRTHAGLPLAIPGEALSPMTKTHTSFISLKSLE